MKAIKKSILLLVLLWLFASCSSTYDVYSYNETVRLKEKTVKLVELGVEPYSNHAKSIDSLKIELDSLYSYEKTRKQNEATVKLWSSVIINEKGLIYRFFSLWEKKSTLGDLYIDKKKVNIIKAFDDVIELENAKK